MLRLTRVMLFVFGFMALLPALAHAQASITGVVRDPSGAVLPGVTVEASSPALIEKVRSVVTDGSGQYRIIDLRPGTYAVVFSLSGFSTVRREGIELTGTFVATIDVDLRVGSLEETITVTGESPIVDVQRTTQQRVFDQQVIEQIPAGRSHINMVVLIPGLTAAQPGRGALADVGGTNNLQNTTFTIHGGRTSDTRLQLDGVRLGNVLSGGEFSNFVPDTGSTQEVAVDYAAVSAEQPFGGLRIQHQGAERTHVWSAQDYEAHGGVPFVGKLPRGGGHVYLTTGYSKWGMTNSVTAALRISGEILHNVRPGRAH